MLSQGDGVRRRLDLQLLGQPCPADAVDLQGGRWISQCQVHAHQAPVRLLLQWIERQPACEGDSGLLQLPSGLLPGGEPIEEELQAHLPLVLLLLEPLVKGRVLAQPEAIEERAAHQGEGLLEICNQGGALRLRGERREPLGLLVGLLYHVQVELQRGMSIQAEQIALTE